jgi:hypothetical protein
MRFYLGSQASSLIIFSVLGSAKDSRGLAKGILVDP